MGTEAQQALERRPRQPQSGGANQRNLAGTRQAQGQAIQNSGPRGTAVNRKGAISKKEPWDTSGRMTGQAQYGGMGYGPMQVDPGDVRSQQPSTALQKTRNRVDPSVLTQQVMDKIAGPAVQNYRPEGSIWDDPDFKDLANEHGANFAVKARNLQRQYDAARQYEQSRVDAQRNQLAIDEGKLYDQQLQHAMRQYAPGQQQAVGTQDITGVERNVPGSLAVDASGAFTGEGKQAEMMGPGPQQPQQPPDPKAQSQLVESYAKILEDRRMPEDVKDLVRQELRNTLSGGPTSTTQSPWPEYPDAFQENGEWFVERNGKRFRLEFEE